MTDHDDVRDWDAAYVLGSLSTEDRRRYERHLADCANCSASLSELAGMPGLLGRVTAADAEAMLDETPAAAPDLLPKLAGHVARRRRRRWVTAVAVGGVVAAVALGVMLAPGLMESFDPPDTVAVQLRPVVPSPLEASIRLVEEQWGTRIEMECTYDAIDAYSGPVDYAMYVTDAAGEAARVATWSAAPGETATPSGTTSLSLEQIQTVEVRAVSDGVVLLRGSP